MKLSIKITDGLESYSTAEFFFDNENIGFGEFGGEPEDNCRTRDYDWVIPLISKLATKLGCDVEVEIKDKQDDC